MPDEGGCPPTSCENALGLTSGNKGADKLCHERETDADMNWWQFWKPQLPRRAQEAIEIGIATNPAGDTGTPLEG
jgi:hypothetical protein